MASPYWHDRLPYVHIDLGPCPWEKETRITKMKTLFMAKGLPGSGKTTASKAYMALNPGTKRVNKDDLRAMIDGGKWSKTNEENILVVRDNLIVYFLNSGFNVIVDDTNLAPKHEARLQQLARENKSVFNATILDFTLVSLDECIKRDIGRPNAVGEKVIRDMYEKYIHVIPLPPAYDPSLPNIILVDVDGTVAEMKGRGPFEWDKVYTDLQREVVIEAVRGLTYEYTAGVIFVSGRDEICRDSTKDWLEWAFGEFEALLMRPVGDMRRDSIVKRGLYENHIKGRYNVVAIFDDRPQVIRECWQELGFGDRIFNVGSGREF